MELCYNLTTIALPRPTNDDSIRTCSFFLLYYTKIACQATILQRQLFYISILVPFFYSSLQAAANQKKTCENYMLFSGLNHFATSFLRLAYLLTHCTVTPFSVLKLTEHNILKTLILTQRFKLKTSFWTCFVLVGSFDISLCKKQFKKVSFTQKVSVR